MKKVLKSRIFAFIVGSIIFGSIGVVSAYTILANDIGYTSKDTTWKVDNVKDAIDDLYTNANTTITVLNNQISNKDTEINSLNGRISELEEQIDSQDNAVTVSFNIPTSGTITKNVGFKPTFISCTHKTSLNKISVAAYDSKNGNNKVITSLDGVYVDVVNISNYYTITDTGFSYNLEIGDTTSEWYNAQVYCTVSK